jgi:hypothetical protein
VHVSVTWTVPHRGACAPRRLTDSPAASASVAALSLERVASHVPAANCPPEISRT